MVAPAEPEPSVDPPVSAVAGQQLSLFPTEAQQFHIIQEAESAQAAPFASSIPQEVIDDFLRHGSNASKTRMRLISALAVYGDLSAAGIDLNEHYYGGYGIKVDGVKYAAWYDEAGIRISRGSSARYAPFAETVPWYDAGQRIGTLYRNGTYALNVEADEALGNERRELAQLLLYIFRDLTEEARPHYLLSLAPYDSAKGGFPEQVSVLAEALSVPEKVNAIVGDLIDLQNDIARYYTETQDKYAFQRFLRFRHRGMDRLGNRLQALTFPKTVIPQTIPELPHTPFITEDEIDATLVNRGSGISGGKFRIYNYFVAKPAHTPKEKAEFLKNEFGVGGYSHGVSGDGWVDHDAKGLRLRKGKCPDITISWPNVVKRIDTLIRMNRYLTPEELAQVNSVREAHYDPEEENAEPVENVLPSEKREEKQALPKQDLSEQYAIYQRIKESDALVENSLLLYRMGEFYELFGEDADKAAKALDFTSVTWNTPEGRPISMVGIPRHSLTYYLEQLRDTYDVTVVDGDNVKRYLSIDHEAAKEINEHEAEFGADGWRAFGGRDYDFADEPDIPATEPVQPGEPPAAEESTSPNPAEEALDLFMASFDDQDNHREDTSVLPSDADPTPMDAAASKNTTQHDTPDPVATAEEAPPREMTQEEIDDALRAWNGRIESKRAVVRYMEAHGRERQTAEWLKNEFKSENQDLFDRVRLDNGLTLINPDASAETVLPWQKVQRRIAQLIREDRFFTEQELDSFKDIDVAAVREQLEQKPEADKADRLSEMLQQAQLASELYEQTGQPVFAFEEGNPQPINLQEKQSLDQAQPEYVSEPVAEFPSVETGLPFDVSIQVLRTEPKPPIIIPPENFRIIDDHLGEGGPKTKFRANMEAISTLKQIEAEGRNATPEEQEALRKQG